MSYSNRIDREVLKRDDESRGALATQKLDSVDDFQSILDGVIDEEYVLRHTKHSSVNDIKHLTLQIDTNIHSIYMASDFLPNLVSLTLDGSVITSVRDLGVGFNSLQSLSLNECGLNDLDGIGVLTGLRKLSLCDNFLSELSPLAMHDNLQVLNVSGNNLSDLSFADALSTCSKLTSIFLRRNPISKISNLCAIVASIVPSLESVDGCRVDAVAASKVTYSTILEAANIMHLAEEEADDEKRLEMDIADTLIVNEKPISMLKATASNSLPDTGSELTHGSSVVLAGNMAAAIRKRRGEKIIENRDKNDSKEVPYSSNGHLDDCEGDQISALAMLDAALRGEISPITTREQFVNEGDITELVLSNMNEHHRTHGFGGGSILLFPSDGSSRPMIQCQSPGVHSARTERTIRGHGNVRTSGVSRSQEISTQPSSRKNSSSTKPLSRSSKESHLDSSKKNNDSTITIGKQSHDRAHEAISHARSASSSLTSSNSKTTASKANKKSRPGQFPAIASPSKDKNAPSDSSSSHMVEPTEQLFGVIGDDEFWNSDRFMKDCRNASSKISRPFSAKSKSKLKDDKTNCNTDSEDSMDDMIRVYYNKIRSDHVASDSGNNHITASPSSRPKSSLVHLDMVQRNRKSGTRAVTRSRRYDRHDFSDEDDDGNNDCADADNENEVSSDVEPNENSRSKKAPMSKDWKNFPSFSSSSFPSSRDEINQESLLVGRNMSQAIKSSRYDNDSDEENRKVVLDKNENNSDFNNNNDIDVADDDDDDDDDEDGMFAISHRERLRLMSASSSSRRPSSSSMSTCSTVSRMSSIQPCDEGRKEPTSPTTEDLLTAPSDAIVAASVVPRPNSSRFRNGESMSSMAGRSLGFNLKDSLAAIDDWVSGLQNQNSKTKDGIATSCYYGGDSGTATPVTASPLRTSAVKTSRIGSSNPNEASLFVVSSDDDDDDGNGSNSTENRYDASTTKGSVLKKTEIMMMVQKQKEMEAVLKKEPKYLDLDGEKKVDCSESAVVNRPKDVSLLSSRDEAEAECHPSSIILTTATSIVVSNSVAPKGSSKVTAAKPKTEVVKSPLKRRVTKVAVDQKSDDSGPANSMTDEELVELLKCPPKTVPVMKTKGTFQAFFRGISAHRMKKLLEEAFSSIPNELERNEKVVKRLDLLKGILT